MSNDSIKTQIPGIPDYDSSKTKRCFFKIDKRNYGNINNAELQEKGGEIPGEIKCVCDGSAGQVNACLANVIAVLEKFDPMRSESVNEAFFEFKNHDKDLTYLMRGNNKIQQILESKANCAVKGIDYLAGIKDRENATFFDRPSC